MDDITVQLYQVHGTDKAYCFFKATKRTTEGTTVLVTTFTDTTPLSNAGSSWGMA